VILRPGLRWAAVLTAVLISLLANADPAEDFSKQVRPILEKHCYKCHGLEKTKAGLNLTNFSEYAQVIQDKPTWHLVLERVQAYEMPPKTEPELDQSKRETLLTWLNALPAPEKTDCNQIASDRTASFYRGYVMSRRLNRAEYNNTVRDLFGVDLHLGKLLPADGGGGEGFDTSGNALFVSSIHIEKYLAAADQALQTILPDSAKRLTPEIEKARFRLLVARPNLLTSSRTAAQKVLTTFAGRAFRRPITNEEVNRLLTLYDRAAARGDGFIPSVRQSLKAVLVSPEFLFLAEPEPAGGGVRHLAALPLATKLSYFLWSSMPDAELLALAESDRLLDSNVFSAQIHRMLADPKASALGERFALQWLNVDRLGTEVRPDPKKYPEFDPELNAAMRTELTMFFNHLLRTDGSLIDLIQSDYTFVNHRLAELYGIPGIDGTDFHEVQLTDTNRGGILGMAAVHALTSFPLRTSPVLRGRWIMEALLGEKVNPPPPDVPTLDESAEKTGLVTLRAQLEAHRAKAECASCHDKMDPLGFGLENFDVLGRWRDQDRGQPIDARGKLPSGATYVGPPGLRAILLGRKDDVMRVMVRKMTGYAFGRELNGFDDCVVEKAMKALRENNYRASVLVEQIATSYPFQHRFYPKDGLAYDAR
jgi:mono/diheme cytochrome c family protein